MDQALNPLWLERGGAMTQVHDIAARFAYLAKQLLYQKVCQSVCPTQQSFLVD
jgi:hypothetical protein